MPAAAGLGTPKRLLEAAFEKGPWLQNGTGDRGRFRDLVAKTFYNSRLENGMEKSS
jgi:hypothetical protein